MPIRMLIAVAPQNAPPGVDWLSHRQDDSSAVPREAIRQSICIGAPDRRSTPHIVLYRQLVASEVQLPTLWRLNPPTIL